jgi:filamentous hemagglutinin family protein
LGNSLVKPRFWWHVLGQIIAIASLGHAASLAQVVPDRTLPAGERSQVTGNFDWQIDGGAIRGSSLFHSFQQFSIPTNGSVFFNNSSTITNIINRVTGSDISNIDGLIRANGNANVFLINPNGIVFGENASLDIGGSFFASTADGVVFDNGFTFSATNPQAPPLLTINVPVGLQYGSNPGAIEVQGASLQVPDGETLTLAGGTVNINGGELLALGGRVELAGIGSSGEVGLTQQGQEWRLSVPAGLTRADIAIVNDAIVAVDGGRGGSIGITARNLTGRGLRTQVRSGIAEGLGTTDARSGDIDINTTAAINLDEMIISNEVASGGTGNAGNIYITTGSLSLTNGAIVSASTFGRGDAGKIDITARDRVSFDGEDSNGFSSGAFSEVNLGAIGRAGDITIDTGSLFLSNGAIVGSSTFDRGDAGNITITATDAISFDGETSNGFPSAADAEVYPGAIGQGGNISINTGSLSLTNGAVVTTSTFGRGDGGNITITATDAISIDGSTSNGVIVSGVFSGVDFRAIGQGGEIDIITGSLSLINGGAIVTLTQGQGNAGNITITATDAVFFDGASSYGFSSGAFSTVFSASIGRGGTIRVNTGLLSITNEAQLSVSSEDRAGAGDIEVNARQLRLDRRGSIQAQTASGQGGNITLNVRDYLLLRRGSFISTTAGTARSGGDGGNITFNGNFIVAVPEENSDISANAFTGKGGQVEINAQGIFGIQSRSELTPFSDITASSEFGISGTVTLNTPDLDPSRGLESLPTGIVDPDALIANTCLVPSRRQGSLTIAGSGGLAAQPDDLANSSFPTYELVPDTTPAATMERSSETIVEPDGIYRLSNGELILGRSCQ